MRSAALVGAEVFEVWVVLEEPGPVTVQGRAKPLSSLPDLLSQGDLRPPQQQYLGTCQICPSIIAISLVWGRAEVGGEGAQQFYCPGLDKGANLSPSPSQPLCTHSPLEGGRSLKNKNFELLIYASVVLNTLYMHCLILVPTL